MASLKNVVKHIPCPICQGDLTVVVVVGLHTECTSSCHFFSETLSSGKIGDRGSQSQTFATTRRLVAGTMDCFFFQNQPLLEKSMLYHHICVVHFSHKLYFTISQMNSQYYNTYFNTQKPLKHTFLFPFSQNSVFSQCVNFCKILRENYQADQLQIWRTCTS